MVWKSEINFQRAIKVEAAVKSEVNLIALVGISKCVLNIILMFFFKSFLNEQEALTRKKVPQNLNFGRAPYQRPMKNHSKF